MFTDVTHNHISWRQYKKSTSNFSNSHRTQTNQQTGDKYNSNVLFTYPKISGIFGPCHIDVLTTLYINIREIDNLIRFFHPAHKQALLLLTRDRTVRGEMFRYRNSNFTNLFRPNPVRSRKLLFTFLILVFTKLCKSRCRMAYMHLPFDDVMYDIALTVKSIIYLQFSFSS